MQFTPFPLPPSLFHTDSLFTDSKFSKRRFHSCCFLRIARISLSSHFALRDGANFREFSPFYTNQAFETNGNVPGKFARKCLLVPTLNFHTWSEDERGQPLKNHGDGGACARLNARSLKAIDILRHGNVARRSTRVEERERERSQTQTPRKLIMYDWRGIARDSRRRLTPRYSSTISRTRIEFLHRRQH